MKLEPKHKHQVCFADSDPLLTQQQQHTHIDTFILPNMSTENLNVSDEIVKSNSGPEKEEDKSNIVPVFQLTNELETRLDELEQMLDSNQKQFIATVDKMETMIKDLEKSNS